MSPLQLKTKSTNATCTGTQKVTATVTRFFLGGGVVRGAYDNDKYE